MVTTPALPSYTPRGRPSPIGSPRRRPADEAAGRIITASEKFYRASLYTSQAERLQAPDWEGRAAEYQKSIDLLLKHVELADAPFTPVEIPYEGASLPGYLYRAERADGKPTPLVIQWNGFDSTKEMMYYSQFPADARQARHLHPHGGHARFR